MSSDCESVVVAHVPQAVSSTLNFKRTHTEGNRLQQTQWARTQHPMHIPIICERSPLANALTPTLSHVKFLAPCSWNVGQFLALVRTRLDAPSRTSLFLFVNGVSPSGSTALADIAQKYRDSDGFLYMEFALEDSQG
mmetsp:Transcript_71330/g.82981  ORF Transcript_71330/g.82981 Transcript_71330/m.82981 type:complete len:137 (-) Transcript_71330:98-508(-)